MANATSKTGKSDLKNAMDYQEHEKTYDIFLWVTKWTIAFCIAILAVLMVIFPMALGYVAGFITFVVLMIATYFAVQR